MSDLQNAEFNTDSDPCRVVLDTNVFRTLCYGEPSWVKTFADMASNGYLFSIADAAMAEIFVAVQRGSITRGQLEKALALSNTFIDQDFPVLLGKRDILLMIGCQEDEKWSLEQVKEMSRLGWKNLQTDNYRDGLVAVPSQGQSQDEEVISPIDVATQALQEERDMWRGSFVKFENVPKGELAANEDEILCGFSSAFDPECSCEPPMSVRFNFKMKLYLYRHCNFNHQRNLYKPDSKKRINDGIDFDLFDCLSIPAFLVTHDSGLLIARAEVDSFQSNWICTPEELEAKWVNGNRPALSWPS